MTPGHERLAQEWVQKASSDLRFAIASVEEFDEFHAQICILCHDAAEKYLKALLVAHGQNPQRTHDLVTLLLDCSSHPGTEGLRASAEQSCRLLNRYYTPLKYPSHYPPMGREQALDAVAAAREVERLVLSLLAPGLPQEEK